jgi:acyl carrier protein
MFKSLPRDRSSKSPVEHSNLSDQPVDQGVITRIESHLINVFGDILAMDASEIERDLNLEEYGMDSLAVKNVMFELEKHYGRYFEPAVFYQYPSIHSLAEYLGRLHGESPVSNAPAVGNEEMQPTTSFNEKNYQEIFRSFSLGEISMKAAREQIIGIIEER